MFKDLTYGFDGIIEATEFIAENYLRDWTLSVFDINSNFTAELMPCTVEEMGSVLRRVSEMEHTFPEWIGLNPASESYVVGMEFTRGRLEVPGVYAWREHELVKIS